MSGKPMRGSCVCPSPTTQYFTAAGHVICWTKMIPRVDEADRRSRSRQLIVCISDKHLGRSPGQLLQLPLDYQSWFSRFETRDSSEPGRCRRSGSLPPLPPLIMTMRLKSKLATAAVQCLLSEVSRRYGALSMETDGGASTSADAESLFHEPTTSCRRLVSRILSELLESKSSPRRYSASYCAPYQLISGNAKALKPLVAVAGAAARASCYSMRMGRSLPNGNR